jgi:hypothetical protein
MDGGAGAARETDTAMKGYRTKKIALPGGRVIEIVYFSEPGEAAGEGQEVEAPAEPAEFSHVDVTTAEADVLELHVCPACEGDLVYPVSWEERDDDSWSIERRCPNCEWRHVGEFSQDEVEVFDDALNDGTEDLLITLRNFARANMEADVERLIAAIHADLIEPMDF